MHLEKLFLPRILKITNSKLYQCICILYIHIFSLLCRFAIKTILCANGDAELLESLAEVRNLRLNRHACIISICDVFLTEKPAKVLHIAMTYCEAGDLWKIMTTNKKNNSFLGESQILKWMTQIALALEFVHSNNFIHRDLKPRNILLCEGGQYIKLGDFGLALELKATDGRQGLGSAEV